MNAPSLFPLTAAEHLAALSAFIGQELGHRQSMLWKHPERADYWQERIDQALAALRHVEAVGRALP